MTRRWRTVRSAKGSDRPTADSQGAKFRAVKPPFAYHQETERCRADAYINLHQCGGVLSVGERTDALARRSMLAFSGIYFSIST